MVLVCPRGARSLVENGRTEDQRPRAESEHRGIHSAAERLVLGRLPHISLPKCVQSWQTPICRRAPLVARVDSTWCRARRIAVRSVVSSESCASTFLPLLVSRRLTLRPSALNGCRTKYPPASSALMACVAVPRVVA